MDLSRRWAAWQSTHPSLADGALVAGSGIVVLLVALSQWGLTADGLFRGLSLGTWLAVAVALAVRRRRQVQASARAERDALRLALARELHDAVAGRVAAIGLQAAGARRAVAERPDDASAALAAIEMEARAANADLRRMLDALRGGQRVTPVGSPGLAGLPALLESLHLDQSAVTSSIDPEAMRLQDAALDQAAYRISEEAIRNAVAHASGAALDLQVRAHDGILELVVTNGPGRAGSTWEGSGFGLQGMRERAGLFGGSVEAGPWSEGGFRVTARLPLGPGGSAGRQDVAR